MFHFAGALVGHGGDVRGVVGVGADCIATASRDGTGRLWRREQEGWVQQASFEGHTRYVNAIDFGAVSAEHPLGLVATGSLDTTVLLHSVALGGAAVLQLNGHEKNVCSVRFCSGDRLLTASWDKTARLWDIRTGNCLAVFQGHTESLTCAIPVGPSANLFLTASGDKTVKLWDAEGKCLHTYTAGSHAVRALAMISESMFVSGWNDGVVRVWSLDGALLNSFQAHDSFIYSLSVGGDTLVTCGEDSLGRVWDLQGQPLQAISLPCSSVWTTTHCPNGDIVFGGDDAVARVFTRDASRAVSGAAAADYEAGVQAFAAARQAQQLGDLDKSKLKGREALGTPGTRDGQTIMVNHQGKVEAYEWKDAKFQWEFTGEVTNAVEDKADFTFDVELDGRSLKLTHNRKDNPYTSAQRFIDNNDLSQTFLQEIVDFITKNSDTPVLETGSAPIVENPDPFTGSHARSTNSASASQTAYASVAPPAAASSSQLFPNAVQVLFEGGQAAPMVNKLKEFNAAVGASHQLDAAQLAEVEACLPALIAKTALTVARQEAVFAALTKALSWPPEQLFPVLDVARLFVINSGVTARAIDIARAAAPTAASANPQDKAQAICQRLALRVIANVIGSPAARDCRLALLDALESVDSAQLAAPSLLGVATSVLNCTAAYYKDTSDDSASEGELKCLQIIYRMLLHADPQTDAECLFRTLVSLGTLVAGSEVLTAAALSLEGLPSKLSDLQGHQDARIRQCAVQILAKF
eukprot:m.124455 g.124455  ORF g.124455 m.124455 type:complete len:752 (+) comp16292_c0_seq2:70-2325(+)